MYTIIYKVEKNNNKFKVIETCEKDDRRLWKQIHEGMRSYVSAVKFAYSKMEQYVGSPFFNCLIDEKSNGDVRD